MKNWNLEESLNGCNSIMITKEKEIIIKCRHCEAPFDDFLDLLIHLEEERKTTSINKNTSCPFCSWKHIIEDIDFYFLLLQAHLNAKHGNENKQFPIDIKNYLGKVLGFKDGVELVYFF